MPKVTQPLQRPSGIFNSVEVGVQGGTSGIEFDLSTPLTRWGRVRAGFQYMPSYTIPMNFNMTAEADGKINDENFSKISDLMNSLTGFEIDRSVTMECTPNFYNFKLLGDFYPMANKQGWLANCRLTAGFYLGTERIGTTVNAMNEMPTLLMVALYNKLYDKVAAPDFVEWALDNPIYGGTDNPIYLDPDAAETLHNKFLEYGSLGMRCGTHPDGTPYMMQPGKDGTVRATAFVNRFKPYIGIGIDQPIAFDGRLSVGCDLGALFLGNPRVVTHEGVDLNTLTDLPGQIKRSMDLMNDFSTFPVASVRIALRL